MRQKSYGRLFVTPSFQDIVHSLFPVSRSKAMHIGVEARRLDILNAGIILQDLQRLDTGPDIFIQFHGEAADRNISDCPAFFRKMCRQDFDISRILRRQAIPAIKSVADDDALPAFHIMPDNLFFTERNFSELGYSRPIVEASAQSPQNPLLRQSRQNFIIVCLKNLFRQRKVQCACCQEFVFRLLQNQRLDDFSPAFHDVTPPVLHDSLSLSP